MVDFARRGRLWIPEAPMLNLIREVQMELFSPAMGIAGVYGYEVGPDLAAGRVRERGTFSNIITNAGFDGLGGGSTNITALTDYFAVGTGTALPAVGDTGLQTQVGARVNATGGFTEITGYNATTDPANPFWYRRLPRVWAKGAFGGDVNLTELGVFSAATGGVCWSRQLFRDGAGLPTTVQVLATEELKVWYEYRLYPPITDWTQTLTIKGTSTTVTNRATQINYGGAWGNTSTGARLLTRFGTWAGINGNYSPIAAFQEQAIPSRTAFGFSGSTLSTKNMYTLAPYVGGTYQRQVTAQFSPADANFAGGKVGMLGFGLTNDLSTNYSCLISHLNPAPVKTTEEYLTVNVTFSWVRTPNPTI